VMDKTHPDRDFVLYDNFKDDTFDSEYFEPNKKKYRKGGPIGPNLEYW
jgi:hypothetical protein